MNALRDALTATVVRLLVILYVTLPGLSEPNPPVNPQEVIARARTVMGFDILRDRILHVRAADAVEQPYQSDRTYPPFFSLMRSAEIWLDPNSRVQRIESTDMFPGAGPGPKNITVDDGVSAQVMANGKARAIHRRQAESRNLDPWAVIADWSLASDVRIVGTEKYRDYPRVVLARNTAQGEQRLFVDPKSGFPVKLDYTESHYLWGQNEIEYVWSTWVTSDGISYPGSAFRLVDGNVEYSRTSGSADLLMRGSAPDMSPPPAPVNPLPELPGFLQPLPPSTTKVAEDVWMLSNPGYNEIATKIGDEIYILDCTQGEGRAHADSDAIAKLFPGTHKVNVIVTDLAWPHVAGLRYWVAQGATIFGHEAGSGFLESVVDRKWTLAPDSLERQRDQDQKSVRFNFVPVGKPTTLAQGAIQIIPIDGIGSEVALMVYLPRQNFLWASDYIQTLDSPTLYAREVIDAARRSSIEPKLVAAEHLQISSWSDVLRAQNAKK